MIGMKWRTAVIVLLSAGLLAACTNNDRQKPISAQLVETLRGEIAKRRASGQPQAANQITRAQLDAVSVPLVRLTILRNGSAATAEAVAENNGTVTYLMATGQTIYLNNGVLMGTRGTGQDLMAVGLPTTQMLEAADGGPYTRVHRYLNDQGQLETVSATCTATPGPRGSVTVVEQRHSIRRVTENCTADDIAPFTNLYDIDPKSGRVWRSSQWVGPEAGHMLLEQLTTGD